MAFEGNMVTVDGRVFRVGIKPQASSGSVPKAEILRRAGDRGEVANAGCGLQAPRQGWRPRQSRGSDLDFGGDEDGNGGCLPRQWDDPKPPLVGRGPGCDRTGVGDHSHLSWAMASLGAADSLLN